MPYERLRSVNMKKSKLEKVLEYMVNGENELANEMLHEHIIESAREIYADLAEEDEVVEEELELDEDEDLDEDDDKDLEEGHSEANKSGDFVDDLETMENEIDAEDYFGEDDDDMDDEGSIDDLEGEMDLDVDMGDELGDLDGDMGDELGDGEVDGGEADVTDAMVNVEDAMEELRAAFADIMGDGDMEVDDDMGDEVADEFVDGDDDMVDMDGDDEDGFPEESFTEEDKIEEEDLDEDAKLTNHSVTMAGDEDGKASPIKQNQPGLGDKGKAVNFAGGAEGKDGKAASVKKMSVVGPQEQKGKMDKKVKSPPNKSEKAKSNIGS